MKQKLALACTLVHEPRIILLDEPTTGVDPVSRREFWKLLSEFLAQGITILMATPYLDEAERCSRVALLHEGRLLALDTPASLRAALPGIVIEVIAPDRDRATDVLERLPGIADVQLFGERAHVRLDAGSPLSDPERLASALKTAGDRRRERPARSRVARRRLHRASRKGNSMKRVSVILLLLLAAADNAVAQTPPLRLTLDEAITRGIEASHRLEELSARQEAARAIEAQREAAQQPQLAAIASYTRTNHVEEFRVPNASGGVRVIYPDIPESACGRASICSGRFTPAAVSQALTRAAGAEAEAAGQDREAARADLKLEITRAFWAVLTARASVDVVRQALERTSAHLTDVRNQLGVGLVPPSDVLTIEAQHARQRMLSIEAETIVETTTADFKRLVGVDQDVPLELIADLKVSTTSGSTRDCGRPPRPRRRRVALR